MGDRVDESRGLVLRGQEGDDVRLDAPPSTDERKYTIYELEALQFTARQEGRCGSLQTRSGLPCRRFTSIGFTVCRKHGARAPQTIAKAERLLAVARVPAIEALLDIIDQHAADECPTCHYPRRGDVEEKRVMLQTAKLVLDRTGMGPSSTLKLQATKDETDLPVDDMTPEECTELQNLVNELNNLKARVRVRLSNTPRPTIIDTVAIRRETTVS